MTDAQRPVDDRTAIFDLVEVFIGHRPFFHIDMLRDGPKPVEVPSALADRITSREPFRTQALADAAYYLGLPKPIGFGLEVLLPNALQIEPFAGWSRTVGPFDFRIRCYRHMDGREPELTKDRVERLAYEQGRWCVVTLWDDDARAQARTL